MTTPKSNQDTTLPTPARRSKSTIAATASRATFREASPSSTTNSHTVLTVPAEVSSSIRRVADSRAPYSPNNAEKDGGGFIRGRVVLSPSRMLKKAASRGPVVLAMQRVYASSLAAAALGTRRVLARQGWAGEKTAFLNILRALPVPSVIVHSPIFPERSKGFSTASSTSRMGFCQNREL